MALREQPRSAPTRDPAGLEGTQGRVTGVMWAIRTPSRKSGEHHAPARVWEPPHGLRRYTDAIEAAAVGY